ncbi:MAG TPA: hypothetical protein VHZ26_07340 [Caulobacteraceae bacterium]|jgi:hypothetical protein|nr:hypothetical protein [Caulobacteraceae bacterium]
MGSTRLDLRQCETMALSLPDDEVRRESVAEVCEGLGLAWRFVDGVKCQPGWIGCGLSHMRALRQSAPDAPLLILEDDVGVAEHYAPVIEAPADADAIYLGASIFGAVDLIGYVGFTHMLLADPVDDDFLRVYNLLGTHAIVYLTERFKQAAAENIAHTMIDLGQEHDKGMARLQESFKIYALRRPMFFQAARLQKPNVGPRQQDVTNVVLQPQMEGVTANMGLGDTWRAAVVTREDGLLRWRWADDGEN